MATRTPCIGGNWKCNGSRASIAKLVCTLNGGEVQPGVEVFCAVPDVYIDYTKALLRPDFAISAQNCWTGKGGAYTGQISAEMLLDCGLKWVVLGHSECRHTISGGETNEYICAKVKYAMDAGLNVVYCIGEKKDERVGGTMEAVCSEQMKALLGAGVTPEQFGERLVIAYEPVWAIGTGLTATPEQAQEMHAFLRKWIAENVSPEKAAATRIQYGGSVKPASAPGLSEKPDIDGFLVGGASLTGDFLTIINAFKL
jgi:triosephosphate isomerase|eukprot:COSAG01_NODE_10981_length_2034_cov_1.649612_2_plen_256_part_00